MSQPQKNAAADGLLQQLEQELAQRQLEMPLLPDVAAEVLSSTLDDKTNAARLAELIQQDQALASHLLRVVNSAAFRGSTEIVALQQALARLGMERIREIALSVSLQGTLFTKGPFDGLLQQTWQASLRTALWSKEIARQARKNVEVAYLCGLLHNVGVPVLVGRLTRMEQVPTEAQVNSVLDQLTTAAGIALAEEWSLPSSVTMTIRFLDDFSAAQNAQDLVAVIDAGKAFAEAEEDPASDELTGDLLLLDSVQHLNFYPDDVEQLLALGEHIEMTVAGMT